MVCLYGYFTEKEAGHYITTFRETGFWPHELPDEDEEDEEEGERIDSEGSWEELLSADPE